MEFNPYEVLGLEKPKETDSLLQSCVEYAEQSRNRSVEGGVRFLKMFGDGNKEVRHLLKGQDDLKAVDRAKKHGDACVAFAETSKELFSALFPTLGVTDAEGKKVRTPLSVFAPAIAEEVWKVIAERGFRLASDGKSLEVPNPDQRHKLVGGAGIIFRGQLPALLAPAKGKTTQAKEWTKTHPVQRGETIEEWQDRLVDAFTPKRKVAPEKVESKEATPAPVAKTA